MHRFKVKISYLAAGERVAKYIIGFYSSATEAAEEVRQEYAEAPGIKVEGVWIDIGTWWKSNEVEPKNVEKGEKMAKKVEKEEIIQASETILEWAQEENLKAKASTNEAERAKHQAKVMAYVDAIGLLRGIMYPPGLPDMENPVP